MKTRTLSTILAASSLLTAACAQAAKPAPFDQGMQPILAEYVKIHAVLAGDKTAGVTVAAKKIAKLTAKLDASGVKGETAKHYQAMPAKLKAAATKLAGAKGIKAMREAFKSLSRPMVMWTTMSKPTGVNVVFCSMAKGSWLQRDKKILNPYYGAKMLTCGEIISGADKGGASGHMKH